MVLLPLPLPPPPPPPPLPGALALVDCGMWHKSAHNSGNNNNNNNGGGGDAAAAAADNDEDDSRLQLLRWYAVAGPRESATVERMLLAHAADAVYKTGDARARDLYLGEAARFRAMRRDVVAGAVDAIDELVGAAAAAVERPRSGAVDGDGTGGMAELVNVLRDPRVLQALAPTPPPPPPSSAIVDAGAVAGGAGGGAPSQTRPSASVPSAERSGRGGVDDADDNDRSRRTPFVSGAGQRITRSVLQRPAQAQAQARSQPPAPQQKRSRPAGASGFCVPRRGNESAGAGDDDRDAHPPPDGEPPDAAPRDQHGNPLPEVANVDAALIEIIMNEVLDRSPGVSWDDIAGLEFAKRCVMEAVVWPMLRPDIFTGLRGPPKGLLLFGPPGTGKTMIGRAIASRSGAKFFNISASSLMSKWVGESEKLVRALFGVARHLQPAVIFIDEIDSMLTARSESDAESSRRLKTEFLVQMDGAASSRDDRVLVIGASNRPQELDQACRRRMAKRLYIPLPDARARRDMMLQLLAEQRHALRGCHSSGGDDRDAHTDDADDEDDDDVSRIVALTAGYSGSDMYALCAEAAMAPVRDTGGSIANVRVDDVRPIRLADFECAARVARKSVAEHEVDAYLRWNADYGSFPQDERAARGHA